MMDYQLFELVQELQRTGCTREQVFQGVYDAGYNRGIFTSLLVVILGSAATIFLLACSTSPLPSAMVAGAPAHPNVLLIVTDDQGWTDVSTGRTNYGNGSDYYRTPNIDALAAAGVAFTDAYSCPNCVPARAAIWSGQYGARTGMHTVPPGNRGSSLFRSLDAAPTGSVLDPGITTVVEAMSGSGYACGNFGKWHLGNDPNFGPLAQGFTTNVGGTWAGAVTGGSDGHWSQPDGSWLGLPNLPANGGPTQFMADRLTDEAVAWILAQGGPWFGAVAHFSPHVPTQAPPGDYDAFAGAPPGVRHKSAAYAAQLFNVDRTIGRLIALLEATPDPRWPGHALIENTVVVFVSDNGGVGGYAEAGVEGTTDITSNYPLRGGKGMLYEGGLRVPMVVRWDGVLAPRIEHTPVMAMDLYPTLLSITGATPPPGPPQIMDGVDLVPLLLGQGLQTRSLFWHFPCYLEADAAAGTWRATPCSVIRRGQWSLIFWYETRTFALYDLAVDIGQRTNIAGTHFGLASSMIDELRAWLIETGAGMPTAKGTTTPVDYPRAFSTTETSVGVR